MPNKISQYPIRIFYEDTDAGGVVYHSNYLNFFERARTEALRELGIKQSFFLDSDIAFVVKKAEVDYIAGAKLDDLITVNSTVAQLKRASLVFNQEIINEQGQVICTAKILIACINLATSKPCATPKDILGAFARVS